MTDPFFTTGNNIQTNNWQNQWSDNTSQIIENLKSQQHQIQTKYKELKELLNSQELTQNQQSEVQEQMQKLSDLYSQNKATLASLTTNIAWEKEIHVNKNINTNNTKSKSFSFKKFMIGCGILLVLFLGWLVVVFYSLIQNPGRLNAFWIDWCTAVNLLQLFSIVFFWLLFFGGLTLLLININKLIVTKNKRKFPYTIWAIFSFIILWVVGFLLVNMLNKLSEYSKSCETLWDTQLAHPHAIVKTTKFKNTELSRSDYNKLIAPINISFDLNITEYKNRVLKLWTPNVTKIVLSCWNWQELQLWWNALFDGTCFYTKKGTYQPEVIIHYTDASGTPKHESFWLWYVQDISIRSEISVESSQQKPEVLNSSLLVWKNPVTLNFDALSIFRDFNLSKYNANRCAECNCDWPWDKTSAATFNKEYQSEGLLDVCVIFPDISDSIVYTFPMRVEQWTIPDNFAIVYNVATSNSNTTQENPSTIELTQLPTTLTLQIVSVSPDSPAVQRKLYKDWVTQPSDFSNPNLFKVTIDEDKDQELVLTVSDPEKQLSTEKKINITIKKQNIIWALTVSPNTVWTSPFEVTFDVSTTSLNDATDEIVWFSRDFWDGIKNPNLDKAIISHTYEYDFLKENGVFYPTVTMRTKKWVIFEITGTIINVKKPDTTVEISLDDNPAQLAGVLQDVPMSITIDWIPTKITRNFWDWETLECDWRICSQTSHTYIQAGTYTITAKVDFEDKPSLEWKINLVVK